MKLRILLKTCLMLGLVIVGRFARDAEQTNPGRSLSEIMQTPPSVNGHTPTAHKHQPLILKPTAIARPLTAPQTASFAELH